MQVTAIIAGNPASELNRALSIVRDTLSELGLTVRVFEWKDFTQAGDDVLISELCKSVRESKGVILAFETILLSPSALIKSAIETVVSAGGRRILREKNLMLLAVAEEGGEKYACDSLSDVTAYLGAYETQRVAIGPPYVGAAANESLTSDMESIIEKQAEDYYRIIRQNRRFFLPSLNLTPDSESNTDTGIWDLLSDTGKEALTGYKPTLEGLLEKYGADGGTDDTEIDEISQILSKKASTLKPSSAGFTPLTSASLTPGSADIPAKVIKSLPKTCRQLTRNLPHYFQPQLSGGLTAVFQFVISGDERFEGFLTIDNSSCIYDDGQSASPDITILADSKIWGDILRSKHTAQKAFMVGQLKVRGNFVLLTKFDQLFNLKI